MDRFFYVMRHGEARRRQEDVSLSLVNDLIDAGIAGVQEQAHVLSELIPQDEQVAVLSSPKARCLHSAEVVVWVLEETEREVVREGTIDESGIISHPDLTEVRGFFWPYFAAAMNGGEVKGPDDQTFMVDKDQSNPQNLPYPNYYLDDGISRISSRVWAEWPNWYKDNLAGFEKWQHLQGRLIRLLKALLDDPMLPKHIVLVTHDSLTAYPVELFTNNEVRTLDLGQFLVMEHSERTANKLVVTRVADRTDGVSDVDVIDAFEQQYGPLV